jgi:hypothetical protein
MPALPLDEAGKYVAAAYIVFSGLILVYVAIMAAKLQRIERELGELADLAEDQRDDVGNPAAPGRGNSMEMPEAQAEGKERDAAASPPDQPLRRRNAAGQESGAGAEEAAGRVSSSRREVV